MRLMLLEILYSTAKSEKDKEARAIWLTLIKEACVIKKWAKCLASTSLPGSMHGYARCLCYQPNCIIGITAFEGKGANWASDSMNLEHRKINQAVSYHVMVEKNAWHSQKKVKQSPRACCYIVNNIVNWMICVMSFSKACIIIAVCVSWSKFLCCVGHSACQAFPSVSGFENSKTKTL